MTFGSYENERRSRMRALLGFVRFLIFGLVLAATALLSYQLGVQHVHKVETRLKDKIVAAEKDATQARQKLAVTENALKAEKERVATLTVQYERDVPKGHLARLFGLMRGRLEAGIPVERLAHVLANTGRGGSCAPPILRRLRVQTPHTGTVQTISFDNGRIEIGGRGKSARDAQKRPEAWFDPAHPITLTFTLDDGRSLESAGELPLSFNFVLEDRQHHFTATKGRRGLVRISDETCPFP